MFSTYAIVASVLVAASTVFAAPPAGPMYVMSEDVDILRGTEVNGANLVALPGDTLDGRSGDIKFMVALQKSSVWSEVKKRSLTMVTGLEDIVDRSPDTLSDPELYVLKRACLDGLKCMAVEQLIFLRKSEEPTGDGRTAVLTAMTTITKVISKFSSEYHEDRFQYREIKDSDDPATVFETVTTIVKDNMEICRIGGEPGPAGRDARANDDDGETFLMPNAERQEVSGNRVDGGAASGKDDGDIQVFNHGNLNLGTVNNFNVNYGTVNSANVNAGQPEAGTKLSVGQPDGAEKTPVRFAGTTPAAATADDDGDLHLILVLDQPEDVAQDEGGRCACGKGHLLTDTTCPGPRSPGTDNAVTDNAVTDDDGINRLFRGITAAAPETVDRSPVPVPSRTPRSATNYKLNNEVGFETTGNFNRGDMKKGYVMKGNLNNGIKKTVNVNRGIITNGFPASEKKDGKGAASVGVINEGPINYGTINKYFNNGTQTTINIDDFQKFLGQLEKVYSSMNGNSK